MGLFNRGSKPDSSTNGHVSSTTVFSLDSREPESRSVDVDSSPDVESLSSPTDSSPPPDPAPALPEEPRSEPESDPEPQASAPQPAAAPGAESDDEGRLSAEQALS